jgi:hypothetical protein
LELSLAFYVGVLGLPLNPARPGLDKLPYRGAWLWTGALPRVPQPLVALRRAAQGRT